MNRNKMILTCLLMGILLSLCAVGCRRRIEGGTSRSRTGEIKDYSARVTLVFPHDLVGSHHEGMTSTGANVHYDLVVNGKIVCQDSSLVFDGVESEHYDLTPYLYAGKNTANLGVGFHCGFPREKWTPYLGKTGMRLPVLNVQILRGNQVTYQQDVASVWDVYKSRDGTDMRGEPDKSTLSFTFYAE